MFQFTPEDLRQIAAVVEADIADAREFSEPGNREFSQFDEPLFRNPEAKDLAYWIEHHPQMAKDLVRTIRQFGNQTARLAYRLNHHLSRREKRRPVERQRDAYELQRGVFN